MHISTHSLCIRVCRHASLGLVLMSMGVAVQAELLIGRLGSLTNGITAPTTSEVTEGGDVYLKKVNAAGGVHGQQIRVLFRDDEFDTKLVLSRTKQLIEEDQVLAILSPMGSTGSEALIDDGILVRSSTALIAPLSGAKKVQNGANVFPLRASYEAEFSAIVRQIKASGQKRVAYLHYNAALGPALAATFEEVAKAAGLQFAGAVGFDLSPDKETQKKLIDEAVGKIEKLKPESVFTLAVGPTFPVAMLAVADQLGRGVTRYTFSLNGWESFVKNVGTDSARGVIFSQAVPYPYNSARKISREFRQDMAAYAPKSSLTFAGLEGYMTAKLLVEALRRAGPRPTRKSVLQSLETLGRYDLGDYVVNYSSRRHRVDASVDITIISSDGRLLK